MPDDDVASAPTVAGDSLPSSSGTGGAVSELPSIVAGRYTILGLLGAGGMGRVYRAHDRTLDEKVALKVLRRELLDIPGTLERFRREVKLARRVTSPHVVRTFDLGEYGEDHFLTMELVEGRSLAEVLEINLLPLAEVMRIAGAMCAGMAAAHAASVLHRDLKPDNVLVATNGRVAITDFGIAHEGGATEGGFVGTPAYMAPEQVQGVETIGPPADIYAFGAILFEMVAGTRPFVGRDPIATANARLTKPPPDPRAFCKLPDAMAELILTCMARDPGQRFADVGDLGAALARIEIGSPEPLKPKQTVVVPMKSARSIAILPLEAAADLEVVAAGLSEEIVDSLTMTRNLRVVPLATVRKLAAGGRDAREIGRELDVDVVVGGTVRRQGDIVRIAARATSVIDGFQLWANRFDTHPERILSVGDEAARAIASALAVDIELPERADQIARATELYLEGKVKLREGWFSLGQLPIEPLEMANGLSPETPHIPATLAMALAREDFGRQVPGRLARARTLAQRAVELAPSSGEAWLARGITDLYANATPQAAFALFRAVTRSPGLAMAQSMLGGLLLEAGALDDAIAHLEASLSLDPHGATVIADLPRAYIYAGRTEQAMTMLREGKGPGLFALVQIARFEMWRGELTPDLDFSGVLAKAPRQLARLLDIQQHLHRTGTFRPGDREEAIASARNGVPRIRASQLQFIVECLLFAGDVPNALEELAGAVDAGLHDALWIARCPLLVPLRGNPRFEQLAAVVDERAGNILAAIRGEQAR